MIFRPCYFYFFFQTRVGGWVGFQKFGKFQTFFFEPFPKQLDQGTIDIFDTGNNFVLDGISLLAMTSTYFDFD